MTCQNGEKLRRHHAPTAVCYTAFKRMSPQGISVGVSGVILLMIRCWKENECYIHSCDLVKL